MSFFISLHTATHCVAVAMYYSDRLLVQRRREVLFMWLSSFRRGVQLHNSAAVFDPSACSFLAVDGAGKWAGQEVHACRERCMHTYTHMLCSLDGPPLLWVLRE